MERKNSMNECIFCKIICHEVPSMKVYEDDDTLAFMDIAQDVDGHILVVPKKHIKNIFDCDSDTLRKVADTVKMVSNHLVDECDYDGVNVLNANDESAGQSVPHFHIHLIPRKKNDGIDAWPKFNGTNYDIQEIYHKVTITERGKSQK